MKKTWRLAGGVVAIGAAALAVTPAAGSPEEDLALYRGYFTERFPDVPLQEFANGVYAINAAARESWEAIQAFPPYEPMVDEGRLMWETPFAKGAGYANCFPDGPAQSRNYPRWDDERKQVITLALAINECRERHGEDPLPYGQGPIADLLAYMAYQSRGQTIDVQVPNADARAAYERGKTFYFARRGQLNYSCAHCHFESAGQYLRSEMLSPALGHATGWPVYRSEWSDLGTLHRRFAGCLEDVRARPFELQSEEYRNLEYFMTHMSNGMQFNGPSARK